MTEHDRGLKGQLRKISLPSSAHLLRDSLLTLALLVLPMNDIALLVLAIGDDVLVQTRRWHPVTRLPWLDLGRIELVNLLERQALGLGKPTKQKSLGVSESTSRSERHHAHEVDVDRAKDEDAGENEQDQGPNIVGNLGAKVADLSETTKKNAVSDWASGPSNFLRCAPRSSKTSWWPWRQRYPCCGYGAGRIPS